MGACYQQFSALLKKNWILKRRHWISTIVEILLPCIVIFGLIFIHSYYDVEVYPSDLNLDKAVKFSQSDAIAKLNGLLTASDSSLAFVPGSASDRIVSYLSDETQANFIPRERIMTQFETAEELQTYVTGRTYFLQPQIFAAVILDNMTGPDYKYTVRMNVTDGRHATTRAIPSTKLPVIDKTGLRYDNTWKTLYLSRGFSALQSVMDTLILHDSGAFPYAGTPTPALVDEHLRTALYPFPTPAVREDQFASIVSSSLGLFFTLVFIWPVTRIVSAMVEEKELKIKQGMVMMGLKETALVGSWAVTYAMMFFITCFLIAVTTINNIYKASNPALIFLFFFTFCLCVFAFAFLMSTLFSSARTGSTVSAIVFMVCYFLYYLVQDDDISTSQKLLASLSPTIALSLGTTVIARLESSSLGFTVSTSSMTLGNWAVADSITMFVVDAIIFFFLALYFQQVLPRDYGIPRKWYFLFTRNFWLGSPKDSSSGVLSCFSRGDAQRPLLSNNASDMYLDTLSPVNPEDNEPFTQMQPIPSRSVPIIRLRGLRKTFPSADTNTEFVAVKGLSLDMCEGQVFCLLGENGAGKSTTINMLTGLFAPTSGSAMVAGYDIATDLSAVSRKQGVCMQHDILYPNLSVREHMELYASIKGMNGPDRDQQISEMIETIGLGKSGDNKEHALAGTLSGGQMRKLSVGIAFLNNPSVVYLDEPSSGMDVASQRHIWDLIISSKRGRVIVLTSHSMEEVEALADSTAIMAGGKLMCCGSTLFLKEQYGVGYTLTISKADDAPAKDKSVLFKGTSTVTGSRIAEFMTREYPFAELTSDAGGEITFRMPFAEASRFPDMFEYLDDHKGELGVNSYSVSVTTLTEVFLKVIGEESRERKHLNEEESVAVEVDEDEAADEVWNSMEAARVNGGAGIFWRHFRALFMKRLNYAKRDKKTWMWSVVYPAIILAFSLASQNIAAGMTYPERGMAATIYPAPNHFEYVDVGASPAITNLYNYLLPDNKGGLPGLGISPVPLSTETFPNGFTPTEMQQHLLDSMSSYAVDDLRTGALSVTKIENFPPTAPVVDAASVPNIELNLHFNYTAQDSFPVYNNLVSNLLLRAGTGDVKKSISVTVSPFDPTEKQKAYIQSMLAFTVSIAFCFVSATYVGFLVKERADKAKHLQFVSGVSPTAYWMANYAWDVLNFIFPFFILLIFLFIFQVDVLTNHEAIVPTVVLCWLMVLAIAPFTYCLSFLFDSSSTAQNTTLLLNFLFSVVLLVLTVIMSIMPSTRPVASKLRFVYRLFPAYCFSDSLAMLALRDIMYPERSLWDWEVCGYNLIFLILDGGIFLSFLILLERWSASNTLEWIKSGCQKPIETELEPQVLDDEEDDVRAERLRIQNGECDNPEEYSIVLKGLRKVYPSRMGAKPHVAVQNLFYAVKKGECLGFLGANGAGKSTTMKILSGDVYPTSGTALLGGLDILQYPQEVRQMLGYCPQFDALLPLMSGREHLQLFARIKCVPEDKLEDFVNYMIRKLGLVHLADRPAGTYSGGNKRKLSVGLSLIGNPAIVFLDEPSTGVDPQSRRFMWKLISSTMRHRSVILTTHSMEEVTALCKRTTIMTSGRLCAIGTPQHLMSKYGKGWQVQCNVAEGSLSTVTDWFTRTFPGTEVIEAHTVNLKLKVPLGILSLANIFRAIEDVKGKIGVLTYSVSGTDLEQIFINFVKQDVSKNARDRGVEMDSVVVN